MKKKKKSVKPANEALFARLIKIVGEKNVVRGADELEPFVREQRGIYFGKAAIVLKPANADEVAKILSLADQTKTAIVPQGGNTGLVGGQMPYDKNGIIVSTVRMNKIREVDADSNTMTVESGVILQNAQEAASKHDRLFPLSLGAEGSCTIGGNLSTNAGGTQVLAYGNARDLVLGLEVVLANGKVLRGLRKLKKDNTGYDLRHLFMGAEGTLGIITAAVLKLFPAPRAISTAWVAVPSPEAALALLNLALARAATSLTSFELMQRIAFEFALKHMPGARDPLGAKHPWYVLAEIFGDDEARTRELMESLLADGIEKNLVVDATIAESREQRNAIWKLRTGMSDAQKPEGGSIKHDISVPVSSVPAFVKEATAKVEQQFPGSRVVAFGHLGDGNLHYNVSQPLGADKAKFLAKWDAVNDVVHGVVTKYHGSISAEHGIGIQKRDLLAKAKDPVALGVMHAIKRTLDPNGILNPGKVLRTKGRGGKK
jgi:FAD/FMN-containing dehydrogenase